MFPAALAAPFARNVARRRILVIYFCFQDLLRLFFTISVTSRGSDKPVCHGAAKVRYGYPRLLARSITACYVTMRSVAF